MHIANITIIIKMFAIKIQQSTVHAWKGIHVVIDHTAILLHILEFSMNHVCAHKLFH